MKKLLSLVKNISLLDVVMFLSTLFIGGDKVSIELFGFTIRLTQILLMIAFLILFMKKDVKFFNLKIFLPFFIANLISIPFSYAIDQSIIYTVWTLFNYCFIWIVYFIYLKNIKSKKFYNMLRITFVIQMVYIFIQFAIGLKGIRDPFFGTDIYKGIPRPAIWFFEPSYAATYISIWFASSIYLVAIKNKSKYIADVIFSMITLCVITSTTGFLGIGLTIILITIFYLLKKNVDGKTKLLFLFLIGFGSVLALFSIYVVLPEVFDKFIMRLFSKGLVQSSGTRIDEYKDMLNAFLARPVFGVGNASYSEFYGFGHDKKSPSNISLELLATLGILGFVTFYYIIIKAIKPIKNNKDDVFSGLQFSFLVFMVVLQANQNYLRPYLWMMLGVLFGLRQLQAEDENGVRLKENVKLVNEGARVKRILHISNYYPPYIGGIQQTCYDIVTSLKDDYEQVVFCFNHEKGTKDEMVEGVRVIRMGCFIKIASQDISLTYRSKLKKIIKEFNPDYIHFHYPNPFASTCLLSIRNKAKLVVHWHLDITKQKIIKYAFMHQIRFLLGRAYKIISTSPNYVEGSKSLKKYQNKVEIIPSTINDLRLVMSDINYQNALKIKESYDMPIVLFIGRHVEYKGLAYLIESAKLVKNAMFLIAGDGPLTGKLKEQAYGYDNIKFIGKLSNDELKENLEAATIFAFPSITKNEAFGLALAEAMYFKKPAVTYYIEGSGVNYVSINNVTGLEAPNKDYREYANLIEKLLNDEKLRCELGENAKRRVIENFTLEVFKKNLKKIY